jgi:hypothetical protein
MRPRKGMSKRLIVSHYEGTAVLMTATQDSDGRKNPA